MCILYQRRLLWSSLPEPAHCCEKLNDTTVASRYYIYIPRVRALACYDIVVIATCIEPINEVYSLQTALISPRRS